MRRAAAGLALALALLACTTAGSEDHRIAADLLRFCYNGELESWRQVAKGSSFRGYLQGDPPR